VAAEDITRKLLLSTLKLPDYSQQGWSNLWCEADTEGL
jgi:hypothetical protein